MLGHTANSGQFAKNWAESAVLASMALFVRILCNTFLESLKHADQPWIGFLMVPKILLKTASAYCDI